MGNFYFSRGDLKISTWIFDNRGVGGGGIPLKMYKSPRREDPGVIHYTIMNSSISRLSLCVAPDGAIIMRQPWGSPSCVVSIQPEMSTFVERLALAQRNCRPLAILCQQSKSPY